MAIPEKKIYPRTGDRQTIYLKPAITDPSITVGEYTMYNDFVHDPTDFQTNNVLYRLRGEVPLYQRQPHHALPVHLPLPLVL